MYIESQIIIFMFIRSRIRIRYKSKKNLRKQILRSQSVVESQTSSRSKICRLSLSDFININGFASGEKIPAVVLAGKD